jgi:hypothetical protein
MHFGFEALLLEVCGDLGKTSGDHHNIGVKRIYWLDITVDGHITDQAI